MADAAIPFVGIARPSKASVSIAEATGEALDRIREELLVSERRKQRKNDGTVQEDSSLQSSSSSKSNSKLLGIS